MEHIQTITPTEKQHVIKLSQTELDFLYGALKNVSSKCLNTHVPSLHSALRNLASDEYNFIDAGTGGYCAGIEVSNVNKGALE